MGQVNIAGTLQDNEVVQVAGGGLRNMKDGSSVTGLALVPWAKFIVDSTDPTVGVDPAIACNYIISDREIYPGGGLPVFQINPLAAKKRSIISKHLYVPLFANRPLASDFPGLPIMIGDFGNAIAVSDGVGYLSPHRQVIYSEQNGTLSSPTKSSAASSTNHTFTVAVPNIPANLIVPGKSIMRCNYSLQRRGNAGTMDFAIRIGTVGNASDPLVTYVAGIVATNNVHARGSSKLTFPAATSFHSNRGNADSGIGTNQLYEGGPTQFDITQPLIIKVYVPAKNASDTADLIDLELIWDK